MAQEARMAFMVGERGLRGAWAREIKSFRGSDADEEQSTSNRVNSWGVCRLLVVIELRGAHHEQSVGTERPKRRERRGPDERRLPTRGQEKIKVG